MIRITGDTHGYVERFDTFKDENWTENDYLIIVGDFGYIFENSERERAFLDSLEEKKYTILFIDGNHENFPAIYSYPVEKWNGGDVHRIRKNILHLMRGQVFVIDGKKFFTMGGAYSIDRYMRYEGLTYWKEEIPCDEEYKEADRNLKANNYEVDYVLTHTAPRHIIAMMGYNPSMGDAELTGYFDWLRETLKYKKWFFGHFHDDREYDSKHRLLWFDVVEVE